MPDKYLVVMTSEVYGEEQYPQDTLADAMDCIKRLHLAVEILNDGVERIIGLKMNQSETDESETLPFPFPSFSAHHPPSSIQEGEGKEEEIIEGEGI